jgi:hypothetical protein
MIGGGGVHPHPIARLVGGCGPKQYCNFELL